MLRVVHKSSPPLPSPCTPARTSETRHAPHCVFGHRTPTTSVAVSLVLVADADQALSGLAGVVTILRWCRPAYCTHRHNTPSSSSWHPPVGATSLHACFTSPCSPRSKPMGNYLSYSYRHPHSLCQSSMCSVSCGCGPNARDGAPLQPSIPAQRPGIRGHPSHPCYEASKTIQAPF
jgi:hypothetical protein